ncbi:hypothetical protein [Methylobacterium sp. Leaf113]|uniref:hypothetical protein n=1 Tax=Methylobacterium sp. Leaf113 TaxID=1736259 RepID=UPI000A607FEC|nr:hypothetical protein [Methylobacterium sp. Leaf113]
MTYANSSRSQYTAGTASADRIDVSSRGTRSQLIAGRDGDDIIIGASGNDTINGGGGDDTITGGLGVDTLTGDQWWRWR